MIDWNLALNIATLLLVAALTSKGSKMNQAEQDAFDALGKKIDASMAAHVETNAALATSQAELGAAKAKIADLEARLAAVPAPVDDSAAVLAKIAEESAKLDPPVEPAPTA